MNRHCQQRKGRYIDLTSKSFCDMLEIINFLLTTFVLKIDIAYIKLLQLLSYGSFPSTNSFGLSVDCKLGNKENTVYFADNFQ